MAVLNNGKSGSFGSACRRVFEVSVAAFSSLGSTRRNCRAVNSPKEGLPRNTDSLRCILFANRIEVVIVQKECATHKLPSCETLRNRRMRSAVSRVAEMCDDEFTTKTCRRGKTFMRPCIILKKYLSFSLPLSVCRVPYLEKFGCKTRFMNSWFSVKADMSLEKNTLPRQVRAPNAEKPPLCTSRFVARDIANK